MKIKEIELQNFRCFTKSTYAIKAPYIIIQGANGSGKTSLLEALYYAGHLRSWKTGAPKELIAFDTSSFFIRLALEHDVLDQELSIGFSPQKRVVSLDQIPLRSFKDLFSIYRIVQITQDDAQIISGSPEYRRAFIDAALSIGSPAGTPNYLQLLRKYTSIVEQRNALLKQAQYGYLDTNLYWNWTEQLWHAGVVLVEQRTRFLDALSRNLTALRTQSTMPFKSILDDPVLQTLSLQYEQKRSLYSTFDEFVKNNSTLVHEEKRIGRSLIGPHLDDVAIYCKGIKARIYASRGQQKFIVMLIKIAQIQELLNNDHTAVVLIDDFITDFDEAKIALSIDLLKSLNLQLFFTVPHASTELFQDENATSFLHKILGDSSQVISL